MVETLTLQLVVPAGSQFNTGEISVSIKSVDFKFQENDLINVIGEVVKEGQNLTIVAEIIQDMNKLNFEYYLKLYDLRKKIG